MKKTLVTLAALLAFGLAGTSWAGPDPQAATNAKKANAQAAAKAASEPEGKHAAACPSSHGPRDENIQRSKKAKRTADAKACADAKADAKAAKAAKAASA